MIFTKHDMLMRIANLETLYDKLMDDYVELNKRVKKLEKPVKKTVKKVKNDKLSK